MGGGLRYMLHFFTYSALLLAGVSIHDVEASSCQRVIIHKKVGDTVEFSACLPDEGVSSASWRYKGSKLADKDGNLENLPGNHQFQGRLDLNSTNLSLTVRQLTLQDSGDFTFISTDKRDNQRPSVTTTLHVHEPITKGPFVNFNSTWHTLNESCTVLLDCSTTSDNSVTYNWAVRNQNLGGSRLQYLLKRQDGETEFTCTVSNFVSEMSKSVEVNCSNVTFVPSSSPPVLMIVRPVIVMILITLLLLLLFFYLKSRGPCFNRVTQSETVNQNETQQVYSTLLHGDGCDYETIGHPEGTETGDGCDYEPMRGSEVVGTGGGCVSE